MAFRDGMLVFSQPGALPAAALEQLIEGVRGLDMAQVAGRRRPQKRLMEPARLSRRVSDRHPRCRLGLRENLAQFTLLVASTRSSAG